MPLLPFALEHGYELRFIEQMPLDAQHSWRREEMVTADEILAQLRSAFDLQPDPAERGGAPAETWLVPGQGAGGGPARVGVIASVTRPFCGDCDRTRLTADGAGAVTACSPPRRPTCAVPCAPAPTTRSWPSCGARRCGASAAGHGIDDPTFLQPARPMSAIGG